MLINETKLQEIIDQEFTHQHNLGLLGDIGLFISFVLVVVIGWFVKKYKNGLVLRNTTIKQFDADTSGQHGGGIQDCPVQQSGVGGKLGMCAGGDTVPGHVAHHTEG